MIERADRSARPRFSVQVFARPVLSDGHRPVVPTSLKSARQLIAAVPIRAKDSEPAAARLERGMIETPQSPCVAVCALDARAGLCKGCGRTVAEIGEWGGATAEQQREILGRLPERLAQLVAGLPVPL